MPRIRTADGVSLSYEVRGDGPLNILFLHGWAGSGRNWDEVLEHLDMTGLRAITYDFRSHGDSDRADTHLTDEIFGRDALAVADAAGAERFVVVGFSMSGRFAQYLLALQPERVLGQVLISPCSACPLPFEMDIVDAWGGQAGNASGLAEIARESMKHPPRLEILERYGREAVKATEEALKQTLRLCLRGDFSEKLKGVRTPTLVVVGDSDPVFSAELVRQGVVAPLSRARMVKVDSGHEVIMEKPAELAAIIGAFVAGL